MELQRPLAAQLDAATIRHHVDMVALASRYTTLTLEGQVYKGLCPLHKESTPSFAVYPQTRSFFCFGCRKGGDAIHFLMLAEGIGFREALEKLAGGSGKSV
jgi:DNA primase